MERDPSTSPTLPEPATVARTPAAVDAYRVLDLLGAGGMGEVLLAEDARLGRQVALKRMRNPAPSEAAVARFLREATIQARLEHPAIVPVHEIGRDRNGLPFFTMKRLTGITLTERLAADGGVVPELELLRAFVAVCQAIELAHARGVFHRDLKPSNIMLGDYGAVYVIDWGVAYVTGDAELPVIATDPAAPFATRPGAAMGTPGYSSPEQLRGEKVTSATDAYALGAILFEILAGERLDPGGLGVTERSPAARVPARSIAPELDGLCVRALATDPADRPTARELARQVQLYIDGDRDLALRRTLAAQHQRSARRHLQAQDRAGAMREAGRALALDPDSAEISELVGGLLLSPPVELPPALEHRLLERTRDDIERQGTNASRALLALLVMVPFAVWSGVRSWALVAAFVVLATLLSARAAYSARRRRLELGWSVFGGALMIALLSRFLGPFVVVPGLIATMSILLMAIPALGRRPILVLGPLLLGYLVPIGLEAIGRLTQTWSLEAGALITRPEALSFVGVGGVVFLLVVNISLIVVMTLLARKNGEAQRANRRQLEIWAWHLEQLLPATSRPASSAA